MQNGCCLRTQIDREQAFGNHQHKIFLFNDVHTVAPLRDNNTCAECCSTFFKWSRGLDLEVRCRLEMLFVALSQKFASPPSWDLSTTLCYGFPTCKMETKLMSMHSSSGQWAGLEILAPDSMEVAPLCSQQQHEVCFSPIRRSLLLFSLFLAIYHQLIIDNPVALRSSGSVSFHNSKAQHSQSTPIGVCWLGSNTGMQRFSPFSCGLPFSWGPRLYSVGALQGGKGAVRLHHGSLRWWHRGWSLLLPWKLLSQPSSYRRNHSWQPLWLCSSQ